MPGDPQIPFNYQNSSSVLLGVKLPFSLNMNLNINCYLLNDLQQRVPNFTTEQFYSYCIENMLTNNYVSGVTLVKTNIA